MIVISGCPRSGTSLMMDLMRVTFGDDRILGKKFPQQERMEAIGVQQENEPDHMFALRQYAERKHKAKEDAVKDFEESKDMNPNGFWEMLYTVQGCYYRYGDHDRLEGLLKEEKKSICKIVSQGLISSDPKYIDKVVYMLRTPRAVAKSQERLKRSFPLLEMDAIKIHTPEMFNRVTLLAAKWFDTYPDIPVHIVLFDDLIERPEETLRDVQAFLDDGDFTEAISHIEPRLRRSSPEDIESALWEDAEMLYSLMYKKDYKSIIEYMEDPRRETNREQGRWLCHRSGRIVVANECTQCIEGGDFAKNQSKYADEKGIDWRGEPCVFECGRDVRLDKYVSIEDSIKNNHWKEGASTKKQEKDLAEYYMELNE